MVEMRWTYDLTHTGREDTSSLMYLSMVEAASAVEVVRGVEGGGLW